MASSDRWFRWFRDHQPTGLDRYAAPHGSLELRRATADGGKVASGDAQSPVVPVLPSRWPGCIPVRGQPDGHADLPFGQIRDYAGLGFAIRRRGSGNIAGQYRSRAIFLLRVSISLFEVAFDRKIFQVQQYIEYVFLNTSIVVYS